MTDHESVRIVQEGRFARLTLSRPPLNILNIATISVINELLHSLSSRSDLCALLIEADGPIFSAGVDVPEHGNETAQKMLTSFHRTIRLIDQLPMPVVAAVHGGAYGGGMELAMVCDIVLAADDLKIGVPEITLGVYPPIAVAYLSRAVGYHRAAELILTGQILNAADSKQIGLVNHVYAVKDFRREVTAFMERLTRLSAFSLGHTRRALRRASIPTLEDALAISESIYLNELMLGQDPAEGLAAFMQKRVPHWKDQ